MDVHSIGFRSLHRYFVGLLIDADIQYGQHLRQQIIIATFDSFGKTSTEINRFNLLDHNEACQLAIFW